MCQRGECDPATSRLAERHRAVGAFDDGNDLLFVAFTLTVTDRCARHLRRLRRPTSRRRSGQSSLLRLR